MRPRQPGLMSADIGLAFPTDGGAGEEQSRYTRAVVMFLVAAKLTTLAELSCLLSSFSFFLPLSKKTKTIQMNMVASASVASIWKFF